MKYRYIPNEPVFIIQPPRGPLAAYVQPFCAWAFDQGYERHSVRRRVALAADLVNGFSGKMSASQRSARNIRRNTCDISGVKGRSTVATAPL